MRGYSLLKFWGNEMVLKDWQREPRRISARIKLRHAHVFNVGNNITLKECNVKIGVMQQCDAPNPNWKTV